MMKFLTQGERAARLEKMRTDIDQYGLTVTLVSAGTLPRYAYSVGLREKVGFDLVLAGPSYYTAREVHRILNELAARLREEPGIDTVAAPPLGEFSLRFMHRSWSKELALAAFDFYGSEEIRFAQVLPDEEHWTNDIPNMAEPWNAESEPVWRWLGRTWDLPVSPRSMVITDIAALRGSPITELARWGEAEWEMFSGPGPDVSPEQARVIPLGTMIGLDQSLVVALTLPIGEGCWREGESCNWHEWRRGEPQ